MNKCLIILKYTSTIFMFGVLGMFVFAMPPRVDAQNNTEKIQLMAEMLRARSSGDLMLAKRKAEKLLKIDPSDENVQQLLDSINDELGLNTPDEVIVEKEPVIVSKEVAVESQIEPVQPAELAELAEPAELAESTEPIETLKQADPVKASKSKSENDKVTNPRKLPIEEISPEFVSQSEIISDLLIRARAQYLNGDYDGAAATFKEVEARDANNAEAKLFQTRIAEILGEVHAQNQYKTRKQMLTEVDQSWERPKVFDVDTTVDLNVGEDSGILQQMKSIIIPQVNFSGMELTRVIDTLSELSVEYDPAGTGVNIVPLFDSNKSNPRVTISLRNLNLDLILKFVTQQVNFSYNVVADAITVDVSDALDGESSNITEFFPISRATIIRLTGFRDTDTASLAQNVDPFAEPVARNIGGSSVSDEVESLKSFFQSAGVNFDLPGANLAFDGEQLIVTQTNRNIERMRIILRNYNEVRQVEIEAKFLEVSQGDLEELGFDWNLSKDGETVFEFGPRTVADGFGADLAENSINIFGQGSTGEPIGVLPPNLPNTIDLGADGLSVASFAKTFGLTGGYDVDFAIRALSRKTGSDLMSAPKVTVLSGKRATITVAQELRYPDSYGDIEAEVSAGVDGAGGSGGAGIAITAGTPQDFITRNVGVEMSVTPNVENNDTISLILEPRVTEFEGFVEYGGPSVAIQGGTTVTVPSGFFQPIFSTREITTEVTVFDGATVVMGGLTRDEVKTINDKVPVLGDIPGIGRLFRSEGETRLKRNLLIFVTANLISPGGSPANQSYRNVNANSLFQNPTIMTPSGMVNRSIEATDSE